MEETIKQVSGLLREFGMPTLFCLYLMWRDSKKSDVMVATMLRMMVILSVLAKLQGINIPDPNEEKDS